MPKGRDRPTEGRRTQLVREGAATLRWRERGEGRVCGHENLRDQRRSVQNRAPGLWRGGTGPLVLGFPRRCNEAGSGNVKTEKKSPKTWKLENNCHCQGRQWQEQEANKKEQVPCTSLSLVVSLQLAVPRLLSNHNKEPTGGREVTFVGSRPRCPREQCRSLGSGWETTA